MNAIEIKSARERRGHSQAQAAGWVGVTERTWRSWESAGASPKSVAVERKLRSYIRYAMAKGEK